MIPLNDLGVNKARTFERREEIKKNLKEQNDGRQEIQESEMTSGRTEKGKRVKEWYQGTRARKTALYRAGSTSRGVGGSVSRM